MAKFRYHKTNFSLGKVSEAALSRTDITAYQGMCKEFKNMWPNPAGGATRRKGTNYYKTFTYGSRVIPLNYADLTQAVITLEPNAAALPDVKTFIGTDITPMGTFYPSYTAEQLKKLNYYQVGKYLFLLCDDVKPIVCTYVSGVNLIYFSYMDASDDWSIFPAPFAQPFPFAAAVTYTTSAYYIAVNHTLEYIEAPFLYQNHLLGMHLKIYDVSNPTNYAIIQLSNDETDWTDVAGTPNKGRAKYRLLSTNASLTSWTVQMYAFSEWNASDGYPTNAITHDGRLIMWGVPNFPDSLYFSKRNNIRIFNAEGELDLRQTPTDSDAFIWTLAQTDFSAINWAASGDFITLGTTTSEWALKPTTSYLALNTLSSFQITQYGSAAVQALKQNSELFLIGSDQKTVRIYKYSNDEQSFVGENVSELFSDYISDKESVRRVYFDRGLGAYFILTSNYELFSLHRSRDLGKSVFCEYEFTGATVLDGCAIRDTATGGSINILLMTRSIWNGSAWSTYNSFEYFGVGSDEVDDVYTDCTQTITIDWDATKPTQYPVTTDLPNATTNPLNNGAFVGLADGISYVTPTPVYPNLWSLSGTVSTSGHIIVASPKPPIELVGTGESYYLYIGKPYTSLLEFPAIDLGSVVGSSLAAIKKINKISLRLFNTTQLQIGRDTSSLQRLEFRDPLLALNIPTPPFSGTKEVNFNSEYSDEDFCVLVQAEPYDFGIYSLSAEGVTFD